MDRRFLERETPVNFQDSHPLQGISTQEDVRHARTYADGLSTESASSFCLFHSARRRGALCQPHMSLLSYTELLDLVEDGVVTPCELEDVNASSIDVHLGRYVIIEAGGHGHAIDVAKRQTFGSIKLDLLKQPCVLGPGEFALAQTVETFNLPLDVSAEFRLKSSGARSGLNNLFACHCDAGWNGSVLTLELHNVLRYHGLILTYGMPIGQMLFHRHTPVPMSKSYAKRGRSNGDKTVRGVKK